MNIMLFQNCRLQTNSKFVACYAPAQIVMFLVTCFSLTAKLELTDIEKYTLMTNMGFISSTCLFKGT